MNKIVRRHYPVVKLPADLQVGLPSAGTVTVELHVDSDLTHRQPIAHLAGTGRRLHGDEEEVIRHIRELREDR